MKRNALLGTCLVTLSLCAVGMAHAGPIGVVKGDITFYETNGPAYFPPGASEQNILYKATTATGITGITNQAPLVDFYFSSPTHQTLFQDGNGQAQIDSTSNPSNSALTSIKITAQQGYGWEDFIFNPLNGTPTPQVCTGKGKSQVCNPPTPNVVDATVDVFDSAHNEFSYDLGNGQNYLTMVENQPKLAITEIDLTVTGGTFEEFKQPRVSGLCALTSANSCTPVTPPTDAPEPAAIALFGVGLVGLGLVRYGKRTT